MDDRELLELAAKAADIELHWDDEGSNEVTYYGKAKTWATWNPLEDDGDALRLAVKLRLAIFLELPSAVRIGPRMDSPDYWLDEGEGEFAATRRAIVRAAAEIGKAMP